MSIEKLLQKINEVDKVLVYYKPPYETKYAVVQYTCRKGQPLKVAGYYTYGEELKTGEPLVCWQWQPSTNFAVLERSFASEEEAKARLKVLKAERKKK